MNILRRLLNGPDITKVDDFCPIFALWPDDKTTLTKGGKYARIIELTGKDYSGLAPEIIENLYETRKRFFENLSSDITVMQHSHRMIIKRDPEADDYDIQLSKEISKKWASRFKSSYRTRHYLIFVTDRDFKDQLGLLVRQKDDDDSGQDELLRLLNDTIKDVMARLHEYGPVELAGEELASYWASITNGKISYQKYPKNGQLDGILSSTTLQWPSRKRYQIYESNNKRYSAWLYIKAPATMSSQGLLDKVFKTRHEFSIYQTFSNFDKNEALSFLEDKRKNVSVFSKSPEIILSEIMELQQRVQADSITLISHRWAVEVFGDTIEELENAVTIIKNNIESYGYRTVRERVNQEALFWSRYPEYQSFNCRQRFLTSENASHFTTFATVGEGHESCSWGNKPVTVFKTQADSEYSFIFHVTPEKTALGNTLIIGGTGSGKTTLTSFLLSQCFKYPDFRVLAFDRLRGMNIFTRFHDGSYQDFSRGIDVNPLQLDDTTENRTFLNQWFQVLTGKTDEESSHRIGQAIIQAFELDKKDRTLESISDAFGLKEKGSIRSALDRWLPDGAMGGFFNGNRDALDFSQPLVAFDMTALLDSPEVLGPMAYYLFHKLFLTARNDGGYAVFVDELGKYLKSEQFAPKIDMMLEEIRKTDGVFIGAIQEAGTVLDHPIAPKIKNNIGTYILFPEPRADKAHYIDNLRLNETEFNWIKNPHPRQVMIKRKEGESVIVDVDLSPLDRYLRVFDSSAESIKKVETLRHETTDWKQLYLSGDRRRKAVI